MESIPQPERPHRRRTIAVLASIALAVAVAGGIGIYNSAEQGGPNPQQAASAPERPPVTEVTPNPELGVHHDIVATKFWIGEDESGDNDQIHNRSSAWVEDWVAAYGGVDDPENRCGDHPCAFTPLLNPFYFALPYNDLDENGNQKPDAVNIPWYDSSLPKTQSQLKDGWIEVKVGGKAVYGQWGDVGPFGEEDAGYVFGTAKPHEPRAGLDLSPAMMDRLGGDGQTTVSWRFVARDEVPAGPWLDIENK